MSAFVSIAAILLGTVIAVRTSQASAAPESVTCGESVMVNVTVTDAAGQPVSDHTLVEFTTNHGGVLAGSAYGSSPVEPLSSTRVETFSGVATVHLLTSTAHVGSYEVVASVPQAGFGRLASGPPVVAQVTVTCVLGTDAASP